jgi:hypothetical protein
MSAYRGPFAQPQAIPKTKTTSSATHAQLSKPATRTATTASKIQRSLDQQLQIAADHARVTSAQLLKEAELIIKNTNISGKDEAEAKAEIRETIEVNSRQPWRFNASFISYIYLRLTAK